MIINGVSIDDTFAEAFDMAATRLIVTAIDRTWANHAAAAFTGFATSVIGCNAEAGVERQLDAAETPDGRPGVSILVFAMGGDPLAAQVEKRTGQCLLTAPTSAVFAGLEGKPVNLGKNLRFFGDGFQISKVIAGRRYWRIPVMDGEFLCEETTGRVKAVGGGNFLVLARDTEAALRACEAAIERMNQVANVIMPFPGGVVRSGSKVGSKYAALIASTNDAFCPTLRGLTSSALGPDVGGVLEIVINGLSADDVRNAMGAGMKAACEYGAERGIVRISAGNYGGKLGRHHFHLREIMQ